MCTHTELEHAAINWARAAYGIRWRLKRFNKTFEQHMTEVPRGIMPEVWESWYTAPFGKPEWNENTRLLRKLQVEGRLVC